MQVQHAKGDVDIHQIGQGVEHIGMLLRLPGYQQCRDGL